MSPEEHAIAEAHGGTWGQHPEYSLESWRAEVQDNATVLGYWSWVISQIEQAEDE